jgi:tetratricopeptide (TPR) repeat protein
MLFPVFRSVAQSADLSVADSIFRTGNYKNALNILEKIKPQDFNVLVKQGKIHQKTGNYSKAIAFYSKALQQKESLSVQQELGRSYLAHGNLDKAIRIYEEIIAKDSMNLLLKFELAKLYTREYRKDDAIPLLEDLIKADSLNPGYYYELGKIYKNKSARGFLKSGNYFLSAYRIDTTHLKSIYELTKFFDKIRFKDSTRLFIRKGLQLDPSSINFNQLMVKNLFKNKQYDSTLVYLKRLEDLNFKTLFTYKMFGFTYMKKEDYIQAKEYFKKARNIDRQDAQVLYYLGLISKENGDLKEAEMYFRMSIMYLKPEIDKQLFELGMIAQEQKNYKKAIDNFKKAYENNSRNHLALFQLALAMDNYYKDKKIPLKYYQKYVERFQDNDKKIFDYAVKRIREIRKDFFNEGVKIE